MNDPRWQPIWNYSDTALRRMAGNPRDLRSDAAARELARRETTVSETGMKAR